jgi:formiminotetrahydrofolate cyclodeaminase
MGAFLNVKINVAGLDDRKSVGRLLEEGRAIELAAIEQEQEILKIVEKVINK